MRMSKELVISALIADEPNYQKAANLGPVALPILEELARGEDLDIASRAASLAGGSRMRARRPSAQDSDAPARAPDPAAVVEAARSSRFPESEKILLHLLEDSDVGATAGGRGSTEPSHALAMQDQAK